MKLLRSLGLLSVIVSLALPCSFGAGEEFSAPSRSFTFTYEVMLKNIPPGARHVRVWIPEAVSDEHQTVRLKRANGPIRLHETRESPYGNHILYGEILRPTSNPAAFSLEYEVTRKEFSQGDFAGLHEANSHSSPKSMPMDRYLAADQLVPIDGRIKAIADEQIKGKVDTVEKARALYEYVFQTIRYDKSGTGWGRGDSLWVCDSKHGNCTDFHSLFISLARAEGIPARFEIGFPIGKGAVGTVAGYHCWAEFYAEGLGWVPLDISEAWKDPKKHDYFFGSIDSSRVQFSLGRDLVLNPRQDGPKLNYFVYPYVEVDGKVFEGVVKKFSFQEKSIEKEQAALGR